MAFKSTIFSGKSQKVGITKGDRYQQFSSKVLEEIEKNNQVANSDTWYNYEQLSTLFNRIKAELTAKKERRQSFFSLLFPVIELNRFITAQEVIDLTEGKRYITSRDVERWYTHGIPYGYGYRVGLTFVKRTEDTASHWMITSLPDGDYEQYTETMKQLKKEGKQKE